MTKLTTLLAFLLLVQCSFGQNLDSVVQATHPEFAPGTIPTYYTTGKKEVALKLQALAASVAAYYEKLYGTPFQVKLAVLDSAHWLNDMAPYGIIFSHRGWVFMHAGMSFESFQNVYGMQDFKEVTRKALQAKKISGNQVVESFLEFYTVHELGHYFFNSLSGAKYPDYFTNEWIASYFAYQYFKNNKPSLLPAFDLFCQLYRDNIRPKHTSVESFNTNYGNDGIPTYGWYHVNFYFLCKDMWKCAAGSLIPQYREAFPKNITQKFSPDDITEKFGLCNGKLRNFETKLNNELTGN